jgi:hypothetical protein
MRYLILSGRMAWPAGTEVDASDLSGNIDVLVQAGHVTPVAGKMKAKLEPVQPDPVDDDSAEEPEEQE